MTDREELIEQLIEIVSAKKSQDTIYNEGIVYEWKRGDKIVKSRLTPDHVEELADFIMEREIKEYDQGYEDGKNATPPKLVDAIEFRREQYGWNKGKMAAMLDMTKGNYSEFLHGRRALPINAIRKAYAIGIPASVLLADDVNRILAALTPKPTLLDVVQGTPAGQAAVQDAMEKSAEMMEGMAKRASKIARPGLHTGKYGTEQKEDI